MIILTCISCRQAIEKSEINKPNTTNHDPAIIKDKFIKLKNTQKDTLLRGDILVEGIRKLGEIDNTLSVWLVPMNEEILKNYFLVLEKNNTLISYIKVKGNWIDNDETKFDKNFRFLKTPFIYFQDLNKDSIPECIIKDRIHIGNLHNTAIKHIYSLKEDKITHLSDFEYIKHLPVEDKYLFRIWDYKKNEVKIYLKNSLDSKDSIEVGSFNMFIEKDTLKTQNIKILNIDYEEFIKQ